MEVLARDAVVAAQVAFGLVPEVLDAVDVVALGSDEALLVVASDVLEFQDVQDIVGAEAVGEDDAVGPDALANDAHERCRLRVWDHHGMDQTTALEQPENRDLASRSAPALSLSIANEIALVDLHMAVEMGGSSASLSAITSRSLR